MEDFFKAKGLKVRNEMAEDVETRHAPILSPMKLITKQAGLLAKALKEQQMDSSEDEVVQADRGSADEDSEEDDEDFQAGDDSDVAEEFDSNAASSAGSGSDAEMQDAAGDADEEEYTAETVERPKKKAKT